MALAGVFEAKGGLPDALMRLRKRIAAYPRGERSAIEFFLAALAAGRKKATPAEAVTIPSQIENLVFEGGDFFPGFASYYWFKSARSRIDLLLTLLTPEGVDVGREGDERAAEHARSSRPAAPPVRIRTDATPEANPRGPEWMLSNVGLELAVAFKSNPDDPVWKGVTDDNAPAYQLWFQRILLRAKLLSLHSSSEISDEMEALLAQVAKEAQRSHELSPILLLILAHQFVDADIMLRSLNTTRWVARMVERSSCAPTPESCIKQLQARFPEYTGHFTDF